MRKQVLSIKQMEYLRKLGLDTSDASMNWQYFHTSYLVANTLGDGLNNEPVLCMSKTGVNYEYPAYTLQDILYKLPNSIYSSANKKRYYLTIQSNIRISYSVHYSCENQWLIMFEGNYDSLIDTAYKMLCWAIENKCYETRSRQQSAGLLL